MRKTILGSAASLVLLALTACAPNAAQTSPSPSSTAGAACESTSSGEASAAISVTGDFSQHPTTTFKFPLSVTETERTVLIKGTGETAEPGKIATVNYTIYNATSGVELYSTLSDGGVPAEVVLDKAQVFPGVLKSVQCSTVGSRIASVIPPAEAFGAQGNPQLGISATDSVVMVTDVTSVAAAPAPTPAPTNSMPTSDPNLPTKATGADQPAPAGFPTVTLAADGTPTITMPGTDAPATLEIGVLKKGDGAVVADGEKVTIHYQGAIWATGKVFDQSWGKQPATFATNQVIKGFSAALVGQTVGSQVIAVIPPDQGYGAAGQPAAGIAGTDTLVFVVDILATAK